MTDSVNSLDEQIQKWLENYAVAWEKASIGYPEPKEGEANNEKVS